MRLNSLGTLRGLSDIGTMEAKEPKPIKSKYLSSVGIICYSTNLCYLSMKILHDEIKVKNKYEVCNKLMQEIKRTFKDDFIDELYTDAVTKKFYKQVGIKAKDYLKL